MRRWGAIHYLILLALSNLSHQVSTSTSSPEDSTSQEADLVYWTRLPDKKNMFLRSTKRSMMDQTATSNTYPIIYHDHRYSHLEPRSMLSVDEPKSTISNLVYGGSSKRQGDMFTRALREDPQLSHLLREGKSGAPKRPNKNSVQVDQAMRRLLARVWLAPAVEQRQLRSHLMRNIIDPIKRDNTNMLMRSLRSNPVDHNNMLIRSLRSSSLTEPNDMLMRSLRSSPMDPNNMLLRSLRSSPTDPNDMFMRSLRSNPTDGEDEMFMRSLRSDLDMLARSLRSPPEDHRRVQRATEMFTRSLRSDTHQRTMRGGEMLARSSRSPKNVARMHSFLIRQSRSNPVKPRSNRSENNDMLTRSLRSNNVENLSDNPTSLSQPLFPDLMRKIQATKSRVGEHKDELASSLQSLFT